MKLRNRMLLIVAAPILATLGFIVFVIVLQFQERNEHQKTLLSFGYAKDVSGLIHELQKERGYSAGHVGSQGAIFANELREQRTNTDAAIVSAAATFVRLTERGESQLPETQARLAQLAAIRKSIDGLAMTVPELAKFYTETIKKLSQIVEHDISKIRDADVSQVARSFFSILSAKESAGLERAMGAVGFGSGNFNQWVFERYISLISAQKTMIDQALRVDDRMVIDVTNNLLSSPELSAVEALRHNAHQMAWELGDQTTSGPQWFKTSTAWVDRLKQTEDEVLEHAIYTAEGKVAAATGTILAQIGLSVVIFLLCFGATLYVSINLRRDIAQILGVMRDIAEDRLNVAIYGAEGKDEFAEFARMAEVFKDNAIRRNAAEAEAKAARQKVEETLVAVRSASEAEAAMREEARLTEIEREKSDKAQAARQAALEAEKKKAEAKHAEAERHLAEAAAREAKGRLAADEGRSDSLAQVVRTISDGLKRLSQGDFQIEIAEPFEEEFEPLRSDFNTAQVQLRALVGDVISGSSSLAQSALELKSASQDLAGRTEKQAATLEQGSATAREVSGIAAQTTENLVKTVRSANDAKSRAEQGGGVVREAITAMDGISNSSQAISQIIAVIDDIAFQTNLLSLNAGVEAARAGEAGRGFAVVATEVRSLAERASSSAKEIKDLIVDSTRQVKTGVSLVNRTGEALDEIVRDVSQISTTIEDITSSSQRQSDAMSSLSESIAELDAATQNNAAMAQEMTAAAVNLSDETARVAASATIFEGAAPAEADDKRAA